MDCKESDSTEQLTLSFSYDFQSHYITVRTHDLSWLVRMTQASAFHS